MSRLVMILVAVGVVGGIGYLAFVETGPDPKATRVPIDISDKL